MTFFPLSSVTVDYPKELLDAFGRIAVTSPQTVIEVKQTSQTYLNQTEDFEVSGSGTNSTSLPARASTLISTSNGVAGRRVFRSVNRINYQPGKGLEALLTAAIIQPATDAHTRIGLFDDDNGLFFDWDENGLGVVIRSSLGGSPVETRVPFASFNYGGNPDPGLSILNLSSQIYKISAEWLGVGSVWFSLIIGGEEVILHRFDRANTPAGVGVYMSSPVLPLAWEIESSAASPVVNCECICGTAISQGGTDLGRNGKNFALQRLEFDLGASTADDIIPLISIRLKAGCKYTEVIPLGAELLVTSNANGVFGLCVDPTVAGTDNASWVGLDGSCLEYDVSRDTSNTLTFSDAQRLSATSFTTSGDLAANRVDSRLTLHRKENGDSIQLVFWVIPFSNSEIVTCLINFRELNI